MPHIDFNVLMVGGVMLLTLVLWFTTRQQGESGQIEHAMSTGLCAIQKNDFVEAEPNLERALKLLKAEAKPDLPKIVSCLVHLSQCYEKAGKHKESAALYDQVIAFWRSYMNRPGSTMLDIDYAMINSDFGRGTPQVADFYLKEIIPKKERSLSGKHPDLANSYSIAARLLRKLGRNQEAQTFEEKAAGGKST